MLTQTKYKAIELLHDNEGCERISYGSFNTLGIAIAKCKEIKNSRQKQRVNDIPFIEFYQCEYYVEKVVTTIVNVWEDN